MRPLNDAEQALLAIADPIDRARAITAYRRTHHLHPVLAERRKVDIADSRNRFSKADLAPLIGLAKSGISRLAPLQPSPQQGVTQ